MPCPICNKIECDHSPAERGQSEDQMMGQYYVDVGFPPDEVRKSFPGYKSPEETQVDTRKES